MFFLIILWVTLVSFYFSVWVIKKIYVVALFKKIKTSPLYLLVVFMFLFVSLSLSGIILPYWYCGSSPICKIIPIFGSYLQFPILILWTYIAYARYIRVWLKKSKQKVGKVFSWGTIFFGLFSILWIVIFSYFYTHKSVSLYNNFLQNQQSSLYDATSHTLFELSYENSVHFFGAYTSFLDINSDGKNEILALRSQTDFYNLQSVIYSQNGEILKKCEIPYEPVYQGPSWYHISQENGVYFITLAAQVVSENQISTEERIFSFNPLNCNEIHDFVLNSQDIPLHSLSAQDSNGVVYVYDTLSWTCRFELWFHTSEPQACGTHGEVPLYDSLLASTHSSLTLTPRAGILGDSLASFKWMVNIQNDATQERIYELQEYPYESREVSDYIYAITSSDGNTLLSLFHALSYPKYISAGDLLGDGYEWILIEEARDSSVESAKVYKYVQFQ